MANLSLVIDSSFRPYSFKERLAPYLIYKDAYEKAEKEYDDLIDKADEFSYLADKLKDSPDSKAAKIYQGYADELHKRAEELSKNGLTIVNRQALRSLKKRYSGEIGRIKAADTALKKEQELRRTMSAKDPSMLYGMENLSLDDFLDNRTPNLYGISGNDLYAKGALVGKQFSSRVVYDPSSGPSTLGKYFKDYITRQGYTQKDLNKFSDEIMNDFATEVSVLPELQQAAQSILDANGATENLTGSNLAKAQQQVIRGIVDNAVYTEQHEKVRDPNVLSAEERADDARQQQSLDLNAASKGFVRDSSSPTGYRYDVRYDPDKADVLWMYNINDKGEIQGYSKEAQKLIKDGTLDSNGNLKKPKETKPEEDDSLKPEPDPKISIDTEGNVRQAAGTSTKPLNYGKQISVEEVIQKYPSVLEKYDPNKFNFYENNGVVYPLPKTKEELKRQKEAANKAAEEKKEGDQH